MEHFSGTADDLSLSSQPMWWGSDADALAMAQASVDRHDGQPLAHGDEIVDADEIAKLAATLALLGGRKQLARLGEPGQHFQLGRYEVLEERGRGGFGIVLRAFDPDLQREVALKLPLPERLLDGDSPDEIVREARVAAQLEHPGIVPVFETGRWGPVWFIATAYCPGPSLGEWLQAQTTPLSARQCAWLVSQAAEAVHHAHTRGVLHLDLKPDNILLKEQHSPYLNWTPLITDFGLSGWSRNASDDRTRRMGGTPRYMAPEQAQGDGKQVAVTTDVYTLGAILVDLLTDAASPATEPQTIRYSNPVGLPKSTPPDLRAVVQKCLAPTPADRYASAKELADDLRRFLSGETLRARQVAWPTVCVRWARRKPALAASLFLLVAAVSAGLITSGLLWRRAEQNLASFQQEAREHWLAEKRIEKSVLNLAWVTHKSKLSEADVLIDNTPDLRVLQAFLADMQTWRRGASDRHNNRVGIEAAIHSLALFDDASKTDESHFLQSYRQGLLCWQEVLKMEPDQDHWRHALAAHLLTYHLRSTRHDWLAWRSGECAIDPSVKELIELPYAELLIDLSDFHLRNRSRSELCYSMLVAAIAILEDEENKKSLPPQRLRFLLKAHNLAIQAATMTSNTDRRQLHRAAADQIVAEISTPQNCQPGMMAEVAKVIARQAKEAETVGDQDKTLLLLRKATEYLRHAIASGACENSDYIDLARHYSRIGQFCHDRGRQNDANQAFKQSIEVLDQVIARSGTPQRTLVLNRAATLCRFAEILLVAGNTSEAIATYEAAARDFSGIGLQRKDSRGIWLASIRTLHALARHYATVGRYADSRRLYEISLSQLTTMNSFTRHPSVATFTSVTKKAIKELDESQGS